MSLDEQTVRTIFAGLEHGDGDAFFSHVADDVDWTVMGTHPLAGHYPSKAAFKAGTFNKLGKVPGGTQLSVTHRSSPLTPPSSSWSLLQRRETACVSTTTIVGSCGLTGRGSLKSEPILIPLWSRSCFAESNLAGPARTYRRNRYRVSDK